MVKQKNSQYQEEQQLLIDSSSDQDTTSLESQLVANNNNDNHGLISPSWLISFNYIKKKWRIFLFFAFTLYLSCCGCNNCSSAEEPKVSLFVHNSYFCVYSHTAIIKEKG